MSFFLNRHLYVFFYIFHIQPISSSRAPEFSELPAASSRLILMFAEAVKAGGRPPGSGSAEGFILAPKGSVGFSFNCEMCLETPVEALYQLRLADWLIGWAAYELDREKTWYMASLCDICVLPTSKIRFPSVRKDKIENAAYSSCFFSCHGLKISQQTCVGGRCFCATLPPAGDVAGST